MGYQLFVGSMFLGLGPSIALILYFALSNRPSTIALLFSSAFLWILMFIPNSGFSMIFRNARYGSIFYAVFGTITLEAGRYILFFLMSKLRHSLPYKDSNLNYFSRRTFLLHAFSAGCGYGIMQAFQTMAPFTNPSFSWATLYTSLAGIPLFPYMALLSVGFSFIHASVGIITWTLFNKSSRNVVFIILSCLLGIVLTGIPRGLLFLVQSTLIPKTGTTLLDLIDSTELTGSSPKSLVGVSIGAFSGIIGYSVLLVVVAYILSLRILDGKVSLVGESTTYRKLP
ncbi:hypothetical protein BLNAU_11955 [Blattamonas nauphoetae]|uniref:Uncharacterized protein n=1 Tax=Blattamonas nauphoetae TaxID=2049346 RepID=A0ABQ9XQQ0_9EUKA|nr:hypothetical protein BLNAU_11955 [Blattamonas nauphoetae]